jgi:hypothetical protein
MVRLDINEIVGVKLESTAAWRRQRAQESPYDLRNATAAEELERLAGKISELEGSEIHQLIDDVIKGLPNEVDGKF